MTDSGYDILGTSPIGGPDPAGADVRRGEIFDSLSDEIGKLSSSSGPAGVDWTKVERLCVEILSGVSKDMMVAGYLCAALAHLKKPGDFARAVKVCGDLLDNFGDGLYPRRDRGRIAALAWMAGKTGPLLVSGDFVEGFSGELARETRERFERLEKICAERFGPEAGINFGSVLKPLDDYLNRAETDDDSAGSSAESEPEERDESTTGKPELPEPEKRADPEPEEVKKPEPIAIEPPDAIDEESLADFFASLKSVASRLREADPTDWRAYKLARAAVWSTVTELPANRNGTTLIRRPDFPDLESLLAEARWPELLKAAESRVRSPSFKFCLDLNRYSAEALLNLGEEYQAALGAVLFETAHFANRLPGIEELRFADGERFADETTLDWLRRGPGSAPAREKREKQPVPAPPPVAGDGASGDEKILVKAALVAAEGDFPKAARMIQKRIRAASSARAETILRIGFNALLSGRTEYAALAAANCDRIVHDAREFRLIEWDPDFAVAALTSAYRTYRSMGPDFGDARAAEILTTIGQFDLSAAVDIS